MIGIFDASAVAAMILGAVLASVLIASTSLRVSLLVLGGACLLVVIVSRLGLAGLDAASAQLADTLASRVEVLAGLPVILGVRRLALEQLASAAQFCPLPPGVDVVVQGAPAHAFYVIAEGRVAVHRDGEPLASLGPGDCFGERGLLDRAPRNATVTTETETTVLRIEGDALIDALEDAPAVHPALDASRTASGVFRVPPLETALIDDKRWGGGVTLDTATVVVVGAGYEDKRAYYRRLAELGPRLVIVDEPGHWSASLGDESERIASVACPVTGDPDVDAAAILDTLERAGIRPDGVLTFWEDSVCVAARVAAALGLPGNPPEAVDAARSKIRTRELSARLGLPTPKAQRVRSLDELYAAAEEIGFPSVVKPEFGASAMGCVRVDNFESLPGVYTLIRGVTSPETDGIFRAGNDLLLEEYLDGVEFDVDIVLDDGKCVFSSVSQNWPTAEPSFQETGLHCPPDHSAKAVGRLVEFSVQTVQAFGFRRGVLHVEGKCTSRGPRIVEVNARMGGTRIHQIVEAVWDVDLIGAQLRSCLDLPQALKPSRKPRCAVVNVIVHAPASGELAELSFVEVTPEGDLGVELDVHGEIGQAVDGPDRTFATVLAELTLSGKNLRRARALAAQVLREPPRVVPAGEHLAQVT